MPVDIPREQESLGHLTIDQLRHRYEEVCGEPTGSRHRQHLVRRILWRLQAQAEGGLSERARRRAAELANDAELRLTAPQPRGRRRGVRSSAAPAKQGRSSRLPKPGTILTRPYKDRLLEVKVLEEGFEFEARIWRSLTAIAREVTGTHWNGMHFFGLAPQKGMTP